MRLSASCLLLGLLCSYAGSPAVAQDSAAGSDVAVRGVVIPTGYQNNKYSAMIQVAVDGSPLPNSTWELEASFAPPNRAPEKFSGHVVAEEPDTPVVFEVLVEFEPGRYALTLDARETSAGQGGTRKLAGEWPDPDKESATVSPVVLLQPAQGAFTRGGNSQRRGALALENDDSVRTHLPVAVVTVVCRGMALSEDARVERMIEGASTINFDTIDLVSNRDQCAQVRDIIPPGALGEGFFRYVVRVLTDSGEIGSGVREFATDNAQGNLPGS